MPMPKPKMNTDKMKSFFQWVESLSNSLENKIIGFDSNKNALRVEIKEAAEKNKANKEIIKFFSRLLKKKVRIAAGLSSKEKVLEIN